MSDYLPPSSPPGPPPTNFGQYPPSTSPTTVLVLGILSVVLAGLAPVGLILGIIGLRKSKVAAAELQSGLIDRSQSGMVTAGKICSIVGTCLAGVCMLLWCVYASCLGSMIFTAATHPHRP